MDKKLYDVYLYTRYFYRIDASSSASFSEDACKRYDQEVDEVERLEGYPAVN